MGHSQDVFPFISVSGFSPPSASPGSGLPQNRAVNEKGGKRQKTLTFSDSFGIRTVTAVDASSTKVGEPLFTSLKRVLMMGPGHCFENPPPPSPTFPKNEKSVVFSAVLPAPAEFKENAAYFELLVRICLL